MKKCTIRQLNALKNKTKKITIGNMFNLVLTFFLLLTTATILAQDREQSSYYEEVLSKLLGNSEFIARFNLAGNENDSVLVVVDKAYEQIRSEIGNFRVRSVFNESDACARMKNGEIKTVIFLSPIQIVDSLQKFYISVTCFQLPKSKDTCYRKVFSGGFFSTAINSNYTFKFDQSTRKWQIEQ